MIYLDLTKKLHHILDGVEEKLHHILDGVDKRLASRWAFVFTHDNIYWQLVITLRMKIGDWHTSTKSESVE